MLEGRELKLEEAVRAGEGRGEGLDIGSGAIVPKESDKLKLPPRYIKS